MLETAAVEIGSFVLGAIHGFGDTVTYNLLPPPNLPPVNEQLYQLGKIIGNLGGAYVGFILIEAGAAAGVVLLPTGIGSAAGVGVAVYGGTVVVSGAVQAVGNIVELDYIIQQANSSSGNSGAGGSSGGSGNNNKLPDNARTTNDADEIFRRLEKYHGVDPNVVSQRLHEIKSLSGRGGANNVIFDMTGGVWDPITREFLGSLIP